MGESSSLRSTAIRAIVPTIDSEIISNFPYLLNIDIERISKIEKLIYFLIKIMIEQGQGRSPSFELHNRTVKGRKKISAEYPEEVSASEFNKLITINADKSIEDENLDLKKMKQIKRKKNLLKKNARKLGKEINRY